MKEKKRLGRSVYGFYNLLRERALQMARIRRSIPYIELKNKITSKLHMLYSTVTAYELLDKHMSTVVKGGSILDFHPNEFPYSYYNISWDEFVGHKASYITNIYSNTIVSLISNLEEYCYSVLAQYFIINEEKMIDEKKQTSVSEMYLILRKNTDPVYELVHLLVDRKLRNKTTKEMLETIGRYVKSGYLTEMKEDVRKIEEYMFIRNAIIHNNAYVTNDMLVLNPDKYPDKSKKIDIQHEMCVDLSRSIFRLVRAFEKQYNENVSDDVDAITVVLVAYDLGIRKIGRIKTIIYELLGRVKKTREVEETFRKKEVYRNLRKIMYEYESIRVMIVEKYL